RTARRSDQNRAHRHQRRRPPSISFLVALSYRLTALSELTAVSCQLIGRIFQMMFSRDQVLALMRDRVHHPAGMRELLQVLKVPRDERTSFKRHIKSLVASGDLIQIRGHRNESIVGRYDRDDNGMGYVAPFDRRVLMDIFIPPGQEGGASPREMVVAELTRWPTATRGAVGRVADVLGDIDAPGVDTEIIIRKFGIPDAHSDE